MQVEDANGETNVFGVTPSNVIQSTMDGEGNQCTAEYVEDLLSKVTFPDGTTESYMYDGNDQLKHFTTRSGDEIVYELDEAGRMVGKTTSTGESSHYLYDSRGFIIEAANNAGSITFSYNDDGSPSSVRYSNGRELHYEYDDQSRRIGLSDNDGYNISYSYSRKGELSEVKDNNQNGLVLLKIDYDKQGRVSQRTNANGCSTKFGYDQRGKKQNVLKTTCNSEVVISTEYHFDQRNRIRSMNTSTGGIWGYRYDAKSQLISWTDPEGSETKITYDKAQNRRVVSVDGEDTGYEVNELNQFLRYGSDVAFEYSSGGFLIRIIDRGNNIIERYSYNAEGKLVELTTPSESCRFVYDAMENLHQKICTDHTTTYLVDPFGFFGEEIVGEVRYFNK